ncbi:hypothetical protein [Planococcus sp. ISL-110]|uniref:hypothetical protein n=1 Tax=Planococcus sp. ISL-110 TaxID=2819167 RepID=UPI001BE8C687|nr:hypothetical protein [Planococcus sp. ISL-110]MBT2572345.1 hypothetical protein [Planococcus sp. ISL-110]
MKKKQLNGLVYILSQLSDNINDLSFLKNYYKMNLIYLFSWNSILAVYYGTGLSEIKLDEILTSYKRHDYLVSSKAGRIVLDEEKEVLFEFGREKFKRTI